MTNGQTFGGIRAIGAVVVVLLLSACGGNDDDAFTVAAAASMTDAITEALATWNADHVAQGQATFASSSTLARQIEQGAPFHVYVSANTAWMDHLTAAGLVDASSSRVIATNRLVIVQPASAQAITLATVSAGEPPPALRGRRWTTGDTDHVPVGRYARASLEYLGWWPVLSSSVIAAADTRAALRLVERNEVDWGIVYATDARASEAVRVVATLPASSHQPIAYPIAVTADAGPGARAFVAWLAGPDGQAILARHGFAPATATTDTSATTP